MAVGMAAALAPSTGAAGSPDGAASARATAGEVKTSTGCRPGGYTPRYRVTTATQAPAVTHLSTYGIAPGGSRTITRTSDFTLQLQATATYDGSFTLGLAGISKVLAKAEATIHAQLAVAGSLTTRRNVSVTDVIQNPTSTNKIFVFYRGYTKVRGAFRYYYCKTYYLPGQNYGPSFVTYRTGKWRSYRVQGSGAIRCGAGSNGVALAAAALRLGCS